MENPLLSVIVPCYNVIDYIDCCLQSVSIQPLFWRFEQ